MTTATAADSRTPRTAVSARTRNIALAVPLVLVNATAVLGQGLWAYDHLVPAWMRGTVPAAVTICVLFALTVESIGVFLAYEAHSAQMEDQAAGMIRAGSYGVGLFVGFLNFWHFAGNEMAPNPLAVTFGLLSSLSPWLWAIRSRSMHRSALLAKGLVDPRSVRFTVAQRLLYPVASFGAYRLAVWNGISSPAQARADYTAARTPAKAGTQPVAVKAQAIAPVPPAVLAAEPAVPPARTGSTPTPKAGTPKPPRTPERPSAVRALPAGTPDADVLAEIRAAYPGRTPSLSEVSAIAGGKQPRAVRLRKLLVAQAEAPNNEKENVS